MLGRLILLFLQIAACWFLAPFIRGQVPAPGGFDLFVYAALFAVIAYLTGVLGSLVLKDVSSPSPATLTMSLILALVAAAVLTYSPASILEFTGHAVSHRGLVLAAALAGYLIKR